MIVEVTEEALGGLSSPCGLIVCFSFASPGRTVNARGSVSALNECVTCLTEDKYTLRPRLT